MTPALTRANPSIASWLPCTAPSSCCISGGGGSSVASIVVKSNIGRTCSSRVRLYAAVYENDFWKNEMSPRIGDLLDRTKTVVKRIEATLKSVIR